MNAPTKKGHSPRSKDRDYESNLTEVRISKGLTIRELCELAGIHISEYIVLNSGLRSPLNKHGNVCDQAEKLAGTLQTELSDLWPRYFCTLNQTDDLPIDQVIDTWHSGTYQDNPEEIVERRQLAIEMKRIIDSLTYRERKVILRLNRTLDQIGEEFNISRERVRQIETSAFKRILGKINRSKKRDLFEFFKVEMGNNFHYTT